MPLQRELEALPRLREEMTEVHRRRAKLAARNGAIEQTLRAREQWLHQEAAQPLVDVGTFVAHISEQCAESGVVLQQVEPLRASRREEYQSWEVQVRAAGTFPRFADLLHRIESRSPYVQVRNLLVAGPSDPGAHECELAWTVRVNYLADPIAAEGGAP